MEESWCYYKIIDKDNQFYNKIAKGTEIGTFTENLIVIINSGLVNIPIDALKKLTEEEIILYKLIGEIE